MKFVSHSQAGQSAFVFAVLNGKTDGVFLDIGCSHPVELSNTYDLERVGWTGVLLDSSADAVHLCLEHRNAPAFCGDATSFNWRPIIDAIGPVSYASVDVDEATSQALENLLRSGCWPSVVTCEHDQYLRGDRLRSKNRELFFSFGYEVIASDVHHDGCSFEDWVAHPESVDMSIANKFKSEGLDWKAVLQQGGVQL